MITILGLGPGSIDDISRRAWDKLSTASMLFLRTERHPCVSELPEHIHYVTFDDAYQIHDRFEDVYRKIADTILDIARQGRDVVYAVPGDPLVGEASVNLLIERAGQESLPYEIINGISFIEPCLSLIGLDALDGMQIVDALELSSQYHPSISPDLPAILAQVYSREVASELKLTLMNQYPEDFQVKLIHGAGSENAVVEELHLFEIDRSERIDVLTTLYLPALDPLSSFAAFQNIIAQLRSEHGCPWDREQTHQSLRPFLIEETYEVLDTLDAGDAQSLVEELGDLLLQIVLHTQIAIDDGEFFMSDIMRGVNEKMIRRHPHVWGDVDVKGDPQLVTRNWEEIKKTEKANAGSQQESMLAGVSRAAPALLVAHRYSQRASKVGFDWSDIRGVEAKAREEIQEVFTAASTEARIEEIGDLMFVLVNWLRWLGVADPESLLRQINSKFYGRFCFVEARAADAGRLLSDCSLEEMENWWQAAKQSGL